MGQERAPRRGLRTVLCMYLCNMSTFDPKELSLKRPHAAVRKLRRLPGPRPGEKFLRGPIPLPWLQKAAALPGKVLALSLALWFQAGVTKSGVVQVGRKLAARFGVGRNAAARCLKLLEDAGLVAVDRHPGRCHSITILESPNSE